MMERRKRKADGYLRWGRKVRQGRRERRVNGWMHEWMEMVVGRKGSTGGRENSRNVVSV